MEKRTLRLLTDILCLDQCPFLLYWNMIINEKQCFNALKINVYI